ncbi:beta-glucosidase 12-like, partial [Olea europaea subsp. europaea]
VKCSSFPKDFIFGATTSAYQIEGAWNVDGKGRSIWDYMTLHEPDSIADGSNGCIALDHYNRFKVNVLSYLTFHRTRFSISWPRILPGGRLCGGVSKEGIKYYNDLIDALLEEGIEPCATLFHWDVPQCLEDQYGGFLDHQIVEHFCEFAEICFWEFGDRVKRWITLNEPWSFSYCGYVGGRFPPRRVDIYRKHYKKHQGDTIGMTNVSTWFYPLRNTPKDAEAASRAVDFMLGWFVAPVITGDYPPSMRENAGERLPIFKPDEVKLVRGSCDFLGINYYTTYYAKNVPKSTSSPPHYDNDRHVENRTHRNGVPIGPRGGSMWLYIVPEGIFHLMLHIKEKYNNPEIFITENGVDEVNDKTITISKARVDEIRIKYHRDHLAFLKKAMEHGVRVKGYFIWSFLDNFEWTQGYNVRFGIFYVDFENGRLTRFPKSSAVWWMNFLNKPKSPWNKLPWKLQDVKTEEEHQSPVKRLRCDNV